MAPKHSSGKAKDKPDAVITDSRFAKIQTDPRFQLPSKKHNQVKLDQRFARVLQNDDFSRKSTVDRYGRKVAKDAGKQDLERFYRLEDEDEDEDTEADDDDEVQAELARVDRKYDPARDGGFSSSSDESSESEEEDEEEPEALEDTFDDSGAGDAVEMGEVSSRLAIVNLDWDNIRAVDLMAVANSFVPADGRLLNVTVYPSDFGRERMEREELEGPPKEIFQVDNATEGMYDRGGSDSESETEEIKKSLLQEDKGEEFNSSALRSYQLERLKYYYAVLKCSSPAVGQALYENMDGREYLSSANFFDMRFIPDEVSFDGDKPRDICESIPEGYKPNEFVTDALTHSKVKLTWDADDNTRKEAQKRAFSRQEIDENDLQAYIGSDSSDDEIAEVEQSDAEDPGSLAKAKPTKKKSDKAASLRAALGLGESSSKSKKKSGDAPVGDMQITFTSGLSAAAPQKGAVFSNEPPQDETTLEKYKRKEKERKERRKERARLIKEGVDPDAVAGVQSDSDEEEGGVQVSWGDEEASGETKDPFDDPFFNDPIEDGRKSKKPKKNKKQRHTEDDLETAADSKSRDELDLLMAPDSGIVGDGASTRSHFDAAAIEKAEKKAKKKGKNKFDKKNANGASKTEEPALQKDFKMDVSDPRFSRLLESHEYAIDPTNPRFEGTQGMKSLLEEGRKRRKDMGSVEDAPSETKARKQKRVADEAGGDDISKLVERVKKRAKV